MDGIEGLFKKNKNDFNFINSGFNLRPLDLTAAIGMSQFKRLNLMKKIRNDNRNKIVNGLINSSKMEESIHIL